MSCFYDKELTLTVDEWNSNIPTHRNGSEMEEESLEDIMNAPPMNDNADVPEVKENISVFTISKPVIKKVSVDK